MAIVGVPETSKAHEGGRGSRLARWKETVVRIGKKSLADGITDSAAALAYYGFLAIPALALLAVGLFSLVAGEDAVGTITDKLHGVVPDEAVTLIEDSLDRATQNPNGGLALVIVGGVLALWTATGAMNALMRALNNIFDCEETRGFVRKRLTALAMLTCAFLALALVFGLLILGEPLSAWLGDVTGLERTFSTIWWAAEWPLLILALLATFAALLRLGPDTPKRGWGFLSVGAVIAVAIWLAGSGLFAFYVSQFGSYNKAWGALAGVIIMLTWLWLSGIALLFGAEVNAEAERERGAAAKV